MKIDKRRLLRNIRQRWETPEKLLDYLLELDKQEEFNLEEAYKKGSYDATKRYSILFAYSLRIGGIGKKILPKYMENVQWVAKQLYEDKLTLEEMEETLKKVDIHIV